MGSDGSISAPAFAALDVGPPNAGDEAAARPAHGSGGGLTPADGDPSNRDASNRDPSSGDPGAGGPDMHRARTRRGLLIVLSSPSGAGKSTIARLLLDRYKKDLKLSISVTTRTRRPSEVNGVHYHFVSQREFDRMRERGELLEWAEVHGNCYGTPRDPVERALEEGTDVLFDIDWQGAEQIRAAAGDDVVSVFVLPPSAVALRGRLERRAEDDPETIRRRLANAKEEMRHWADYDYVIVNDQLQDAFAGVAAILDAERLKRHRAASLDRFVDGLSNGL